MDENHVVDRLAALAQPTRLDAFRRLAASEPLGVAAGELARRLDVPQNTLSAHLTILAHAGLVASERQGRSMIYRARLGALGELVLFLLHDCCDGRPEICTPLVAQLSSRCPRTDPPHDRSSL